MTLATICVTISQLHKSIRLYFGSALLVAAVVTAAMAEKPASAISKEDAAVSRNAIVDIARKTAVAHRGAKWTKGAMYYLHTDGKRWTVIVCHGRVEADGSLTAQQGPFTMAISTSGKLLYCSGPSW